MADLIHGRLKEVRKAKGLTQKEFATTLKVKQSYYSDVENGKRPFSTQMMAKLIDIHKVNPNFLLAGIEEMFFKNEEDVGRVNSTHLNEKISPNSNNEKWGESVGSPVGFEKQKVFIESAVRRFLDELRGEYPDLAEVYDDAFALIDFQFFIESFNKAYLHQIILSDQAYNEAQNGNQSYYNRLKENKLETLRKMQTYHAALHKLKEAITQFYSDFAPFDTKNIIADHFPGLKRK